MLLTARVWLIGGLSLVSGLGSSRAPAEPSGVPWPTECAALRRSAWRGLAPPPTWAHPYSLELLLLEQRLRRILEADDIGDQGQTWSPSEQATQAITKLYRQAPEPVEWALAYVATQVDFAGGMTASRAAHLFHALSGRPGPLLWLVSQVGNDPRRAVALRAMRPPLDSTEHAVVLRFACDAAWILSVEAADTVAVDLRPNAGAAAAAAPEVIQLAYHLLNESGRDTLRRIVHATVPSLVASLRSP